MRTSNWLRVKVIACRISCSELKRGDQQKNTWFKGPLLWTFKNFFSTFWIFKGCNTRLWNHTCCGLPFPKPNLETSADYLQRHFINHPACLFLEQITDTYIDLLFWVLRYPVHCCGLDLLPPGCLSLLKSYCHFNN